MRNQFNRKLHDQFVSINSRKLIEVVNNLITKDSSCFSLRRLSQSGFMNFVKIIFVSMSMSAENPNRELNRSLSIFKLKPKL